MSLSLGVPEDQVGMTVNGFLGTAGGLNVLTCSIGWVPGEASLSCDGS